MNIKQTLTFQVKVVLQKNLRVGLLVVMETRVTVLMEVFLDI